MKLLITTTLLVYWYVAVGAQIVTKREAQNGDDTVKERYVQQWEGTAGPYKEMRENSLQGKLEADHIPPKSVYEALPSSHPQHGILPGDMLTVLVRYGNHRPLLTTGNSKEAQEFRRLQAEDMKSGNLYFVIMANIEAYVQQGFVNGNPALRRGLLALLDEHVDLGSINAAQRAHIISETKL